MFGMGKMKVKVYFYHLFILTVVMLLCFYLMYRDMKRIESNMLNLYQRCNNLDKLLTSAPKKTNDKINDNNLEQIYQSINNDNETDVNNINEIDDNSDDEEYDEINENGEENESNILQDETNKTQDNEGNSNETNNEENNDTEDIEVKEVLQNVILMEEENEEEVNNDVDDVEDLLNSIDNESIDFSKLTEKQLLSKTNNELKEYLKNAGKSTTGNKDQLVKNILGLE